MQHPKQILGISSGLVLVDVMSQHTITHLSIFDPITKQFVELPQPPTLNHYFGYGIVCDFFEHDLQFSTCKIFLVCNQKACIYSSSSHTWENLDCFSNFRCDEFYPSSCIMYKNHKYVAIYVTKDDE